MDQYRDVLSRVQPPYTQWFEIQEAYVLKKTEGEPLILYPMKINNRELNAVEREQRTNYSYGPI